MTVSKIPKSKFSVVSLGCARTLVDTEKMVDDLQQVGFQLTAEGCGESVTILNTCSFIQSAIAETEQNIELLSQRKQNGLIKYLVVAGCYVSRFKKADLIAKYPEVDLWVSTQEEKDIRVLLSQLVFKRKFQPTGSHQYIKLTPSHYAYLKISEGCDNWCAFCTIPKIRGKHTSKPLDEVIKEAQLQLSFGVKELIIVAEDTTAWGEDIYGKPSLPILLEALAQLPVEWIRLMYIFPSRVDDALIDVMVKYPTICPYMDMPVQHVNSELLAAMNRRHDRAFLENVIRQFESRIPHFIWRTTFILGFPGETEAHVDELIDFIERFPVVQLGCFPYSEERETRSARMPGKVDASVIQDRIRRVMKRQYDLIQERHAQLKGQRLRVLYEGDGEGRSYREAPDVDGRILISNADHLIPGTFVDVQVTGVKGYDLLARV